MAHHELTSLEALEAACEWASDQFSNGSTMNTFTELVYQGLVENGFDIRPVPTSARTIYK